MGEIFMVEDLRRSSWREDYEERTTREFEKRKRELDAERERRERVARKAEEKRQAVASTDWYAAIDTRIRTHFKDWAWAAIDERIQKHIEIEQKPLVEATGDIFGQFRAQLRAEFKHAIEQAVEVVGERFATLEQQQASITPAALTPWLDARIKVALAHERDVVERSLEMRLAALEERLRAAPGKLPVAKTWREESVTYAGEVVSHDGASYQALRDTAQMPGGSDWVCVARAGRDGQTPNFRGGFDAYKKYQALDVVEFDGSSFVAIRDNPGIPGFEDGWQFLSGKGSRGPVGDVGPEGRRGTRGPRGEATPTIISWVRIVKIFLPFQF